jgi:hypothetical protein
VFGLNEFKFRICFIYVNSYIYVHNFTFTSYLHRPSPDLISSISNYQLWSSNRVHLALFWNSDRDFVTLFFQVFLASKGEQSLTINVPLFIKFDFNWNVNWNMTLLVVLLLWLLLSVSVHLWHLTPFSVNYLCDNNTDWLIIDCLIDCV